MKLQDIIKRGLELGLEAVEVYASTSESNTIKIDEGKLDSYNIKEIFSVSIRGLKNGKMGYVSSESLDDEIVEEALHSLVTNVEFLDATEPEFMFEGGSTYQEVPTVLADYKNYNANEKIEMLKGLEKSLLAKSDKIIKVGYCQYSENYNHVEIVNSKGLDLSREYSYIVTYAGALASENDQTVNGMSGDVNTKFKELELERIVNEASEQALSQLGAGSIATGHYPVVLSRDVSTSILRAFSSVFSGDAALRRMTVLADKKGQKVFGDNINILDDPFCDKALIKTSFDDEGVPCKTKHVVQNGVFNGLLHTLKTANFFKEAPTGNGHRAGGALTSGPTNLYLQEGSLTKDEIIATVNDGIYITEVNGLHAGLNPISGDFNVQSSGFVIKDGKLDRPITLFVLSGNFYELMNNVEEIGNDIEPRFTGVAAPTIKIGSLAISGK